MEKNYRIMPPPQKYLTLPQIFAKYGSRPIIAYGCKLKNNVPLGGYIIAVANEAGGDIRRIKAYMRQLKERFTDKEPISFICVREDTIIYDTGAGNIKTLPPIETKEPSKQQKALESMSDEILARALAAIFKE
ncbi:MAG: hypothetical protein FWG65_02235 [Turicibacter sp.]|nr:hypothetical protein [Turicibacter sp.]